MKRYINEPAEEPPMPDWPEPSPDDIEPSPKPEVRVTLDLSVNEFVALQLTAEWALALYKSKPDDIVMSGRVSLAELALAAAAKRNTYVKWIP